MPDRGNGSDSGSSVDSKPHDPSPLGWALIYLVIGVVWAYVRLKDLAATLRWRARR